MPRLHGEHTVGPRIGRPVRNPGNTTLTRWQICDHKVFSLQVAVLDLPWRLALTAWRNSRVSLWGDGQILCVLDLAAIALEIPRGAEHLKHRALTPPPATTATSEADP